MKSSRTSTEREPEALLVREAGVPYRPSPARDPFAAWIALMEAVEALCPRWPSRERKTTGEFKL
jgi:hypothetical protein